MRAISTLSFEDGTSTRGCRARLPLRMRVKRSPIGSVVIRPSPTCLHHAGNFSLERETAKTDAAHVELAQETARASADAAAVTLANLVEFQLPSCLRKLTGSSHSGSASLRALGAEGHAEQL